jgi:O-antigen ligase
LGGYYSWEFNTTTFTSVPHNAYVQIILKFGLLGLLIYFLLAVKFFRDALAVRKKSKPGPMNAYIEMGIVNFGAAHTYILGYSFEPMMLIYLAVGISAAKFSRETLQSSRLHRSRAALPHPFPSGFSRNPSEVVRS